MVIKNLRLGENIAKQTGIAYVDNEPVAEASWVLVRLG